MMLNVGPVSGIPAFAEYESIATKFQLWNGFVFSAIIYSKFASQTMVPVNVSAALG